MQMINALTYFYRPGIWMMSFLLEINRPAVFRAVQLIEELDHINL